jgi:Uma2 family endonuclease
VNGLQPDVAWASSGFFVKHGDTTPFPEAPEICIEIVSPSNLDDEIRDKTQAYIAAGAREVWVVYEDGSVRFYDAAGERSSSSYPVALSPPAPAPHA